MRQQKTPYCGYAGYSGPTMKLSSLLSGSIFQLGGLNPVSLVYTQHRKDKSVPSATLALGVTIA